MTNMRYGYVLIIISWSKLFQSFWLWSSQDTLLADPFSEHYTPLHYTNQRINLPHQPLAKLENGLEVPAQLIGAIIVNITLQNGSLELDYKTMALLASLPLDCIHKEYPRQVNQVRGVMSKEKTSFCISSFELFLERFITRILNKII